MTPREAAVLLTKLAAYDNRQPSEAAARAWAEVLADVELQEALDAVPEHFRQSAEWVMPVHILGIVRDHRREAHRIEREIREAEQAAIEAAAAVPTQDRAAEADDLVSRLAAKLGPSDPTVLRRREWVEHERRQQRQRRAEAEPNPHFTGWPPPGGWPDPTADTA